jgi:predicted nuclease of predicted toxin-antitoxin system
MKLLLDMNLPALWCEMLLREGHDAVHWSAVGNARSTDAELLEWAAREGRLLVTHDLDFGALMAATGGKSPSVIIFRTQGASTVRVFDSLCRVLRDQREALDAGAIVIIDDSRSRVRTLPLR